MNKSIAILEIVVLLITVNFSFATIKNVKIVEGVDIVATIVESITSTATMEEDDIAFPDPIYGPEDLYFLNGRCFETTVGRFDYSICPFQNITQRRSIGQRGSTLIGVWGYWLPSLSNSSYIPTVPGNMRDQQLADYTSMRYIDGKSCREGRQRFSADVLLRCDNGGEGFQVLSVEEDEGNACRINISLGIPLPCSLFRTINTE